MIKKYYIITFLTIAFIHFLILYLFGISYFITTLLFYWLIYRLLKITANIITDIEFKKTVLFNIKVILIICLSIEFACTFIFKALNNSSENENGIYFSVYMRKNQLNMLKELNIINNEKTPWENGYVPYYTHYHSSKDFNFKVQYNSIGLRGEVKKKKKDSNEYRIVVLGDSFVEGFGTSNDSTFPKLLEKKMNSVSLKTSVINGGICGSNPLYEINLYHNKLEEYNPNLVIMVINNSDISDYKISKNMGKMPIKEYLYAISHIYRVIDALLYLDRQTKLKKRNKIPEDVNNLIQSILKFKQELQKKNKQFLLVYIPLQQEIKSKKNNQIQIELLKNDIEFIDLQLEYSRAFLNDINKYYWKNDGHHTSLGYNMMAEKVGQKIKEINYVRCN